MPDLWMPGAVRHDIGDHAPTDQQYPPKCITHITWDRSATQAKPADHVSFETLVSYFTGTGKAVAPHLVWDPFTGQIAQLVPADSRSKSVMDLAGGTRTNRAGRVVLQVEAVYFPYTRYGGKVYPKLTDTPCKGWDALHAWIKTWGVPDAWPMGRPADFTSHRDEHVWETEGGYYAHSQVPENTHQDPGSWPAFPAAPKPPSGATGATKPTYQPFPGAQWFTMGRKSPIVAAMHRRLVAVGCNRYTSSANKDVIGRGDKASYEAFQRKCGYSGDSAKWPPGPTTWNLLKVPKVT